MKILHVIASANPAKGGPIEGLVRQAEATQNICSRHLVTLDPPEADFLKDYPVQVTALGAPKRGGAYGFLDHYRHSPKLIPWLRENVAGYDAVIVHGLWNYSALAAAWVLPKAAVPYFVFTHGQLDPWFRRRYPLKALAKQLSWSLIEGRLLKRARAVLFTTEDERHLAHNAFVGWGGYDSEVVQYGTAEPPPMAPTQARAFAEAVPSLAGRRTLLFLSRIHPKKGCDLLIEAFAAVARNHPDVDLVMAGPDQDGWAATLQGRALALGLGARIHWPGMLQGDAKWGAYYTAEALVLPSHSENFGIVVAEALGCGRPVLITDKVNIWRAVEQGGAGLVSADTAEGFTGILATLLALSPQEKGLMGERARRLFMERYDVKGAARNVLATIDRRRGLSLSSQLGSANE